MNNYSLGCILAAGATFPDNIHVYLGSNINSKQENTASMDNNYLNCQES